MKFRLKGASGPYTGKPFDLTEDTLIGAGHEADIHLEGVMERHARIVFEDGILSLESVGECQVNGRPARRARLESGDEIRFGPHRFVLQAPGLKPARVLDQAGRRRVSPWTWVVVAALAAAAIGGLVALVVGN